MFFGIVVKSGKVATQTLERTLQITNVALSGKGNAVLYLTVDNTTTVLCTLRSGSCENVQMSLLLGEGAEVTFRSQGTGDVHVTGMEQLSFEGEDLYDPEVLAQDEDLEEELEGEDSDGAEDMDGFIVDDADDDEEDDEEDEDEEDSDEDSAVVSQALEADEEDEEEEEEDSEEDIPKKKQPVTKQKAQEVKQQKKAEQKKAEQKKAEEKKAKESNKRKNDGQEEPKAKQSKPSVVTLGAGVRVLDAKVGAGKEAKRGHICSMQYVGRLASNKKVFDRSRKPFQFTLGSGEVIKGWDIGVAGMKVGGKRRIMVPAAAGYGKRGAPPDIPRNADLEFDVQLVKLSS